MACEHIRSVKFDRIEELVLTKANKVTGDKLHCSVCKKDYAFILCLQVNCGHIGCGSIFAGDGWKHFNATKHSVSLNIKEKKLVCFQCNISCDRDYEDDKVNSLIENLLSICILEEKEVDLEAAERYEMILKSEPVFNFVFDDFSSSSKPIEGVCGLQNLGNSCYMNSVIQSLSNLEHIKYLFGKECKGYYNNNEGLSFHFSNLIQTLWDSKRNYISPEEFVNEVGKIYPSFSQYSQQDAQEFLRCILDGLHEENKCTINMNGKEYSQISDIFEGAILSRVKCLSCGQQSSSQDKFFDLSISIPSKDSDDNDFQSKVTLKECLKNFCSTEHLTGEDQFYCDKCKSISDSKKEIIISKTPEVLCIHIKRFKYDEKGIKISTIIEYQQDLDLFPYSINTVTGTNYQLESIVSHSGGFSGGHYMAYCKNKMNEKWYEFNDSRCSEIRENDVLNVEPYLLFYSKTKSQDHFDRNIKVLQTIENQFQETEEEMGFLYISNLWFEKRKIFSEVGQIDNLKICCKHEKIHPKLSNNAGDLVTLITPRTWDYLVDIYGGGPKISDLSPCDLCLTEEENIKNRRAKEREEIKKRNVNTDDYWCIINVEWVKEWLAFVKGITDQIPKKINNRPLLKKDNTPVGGLEIETHYRVVSPKVWEYLMEMYGGGPEIKRVEKNIYSKEKKSSLFSLFSS